MTFSASIRRFAPWLNLPLGLLVVLLQRLPALRVAGAGGDLACVARAGDLLRAAVTAAALGAVHSLAGATAYVQTPVNPVRGTVGTQLDVFFTYTGTPSPPASFRVTGTLPPGLSFVPAPLLGTIRSDRPRITGIPTQAGSFTITVQGFNIDGLTNGIQQPINFIITGNSPPLIVTQPQNVTASAGGTATLSVQATGSPAPTFQWTRNGAPLFGATAASLVFSIVQPSDAGTYAVVVSSGGTSVTSNSVSLTVVAGGPPPVLVAQPLSVTVAAGSTAALTVVATGTPAPTYQWRKDGAAIAGATDATLTLPRVATASAGNYTVAVNSGGTAVASNPATLTVGGGEGRLANLSVRTNLGANSALIVGFATNGMKSVLIRGIGPTLDAFGVPGTYADPRLELFNGAAAKIGENDDWNATLVPVFGAVGAFPLTLASKDAALQASLAGTHSTHLSGPNSGVVLVELYDSGPGMAVRLVNVSARNLVGTGDNILIAGFVVDGSVGKTLLIRAVGPTLGSFGVPGTLVDPKLEIFNAATQKVVENDNWSPTLASLATSVGAFPLLTGSRDAALLITLPPGAYSAQVSGVGGGTGEALVEVYEVP